MPSILLQYPIASPQAILDLTVGIFNPGKFVYIGNVTSGLPAAEDIDGSIRLEFTTSDSDAHIALRKQEVWNDTGFRFASSSVSLGRDLRVGAVGGYIESFNISEIDQHIKALILHRQFDNRGTTQPAHTPALGIRQDFDIFPGPATGEIIAKTIGQVFSALPTRILHSAVHTAGSVGAIKPIELSYYKGTDNTGSLISRVNLPTSQMVAGQSFTVLYDDDIGFEGEQNIFFEFISENNISLATNVDGDVITTQDGHLFAELDVLTSNLMLNEGLGFMFDENLKPMTSIEFPL